MTTIQQDREALKAAYKKRDGKPAIKWVTKVNKMSDDQVYTILLRLRTQGVKV